MGPTLELIEILKKLAKSHIFFWFFNSCFFILNQLAAQNKPMANNSPFGASDAGFLQPTPVGQSHATPASNGTSINPFMWEKKKSSDKKTNEKRSRQADTHVHTNKKLTTKRFLFGRALINVLIR